MMNACAVREWSWPLPFRATSVRHGRSQVAAVLGSFDVQSAIIDDACAVVSELLGNAVRHARPLSDGRVLLTMTVDESSVSIAVVDGGGPTVPSLVRPKPMSLAGRGLEIVHTLTSSWGVRKAAEGNTVYAVLQPT
ncbi:MAG: ATP-binding protein [Propionibacteriales bacterium]|nr:ATP-binding protein [Propionibacteriales bacterium]